MRKMQLISNWRNFLCGVKFVLQLLLRRDSLSEDASDCAVAEKYLANANQNDI